MYDDGKTEAEEVRGGMTALVIVFGFMAIGAVLCVVFR